MKILKVLGIVIAAIVVLVAGGIAVVTSQFDGNRIKAELAKAVQDTKQRTLKINGDLELSFWPSVGIRATKLSLSEHASAKEFAAVDSARLSVAVMPLLSGKIVANALEVSGARITMIKHKDGSRNTDDFIATGPRESRMGNLQALIDIAGIKLADVKLTWHDEKTGSTTAVSGLDLATGRVRADMANDSLRIDALLLTVRGAVDAGRFDIRLQAPKVSITREKSESDPITVSATLSGTHNVKIGLMLSGIARETGAIRVARVALDLDTTAGETSVKGQLNSALSVDLTRQSVTVAALAGELDIVNPQMPMKQLTVPVAGALRADLAGQSASGDIVTNVGGSKVALKFHIARFAPLAFDFDLSADKLDVDKYLPARRPGGDKKTGDDKLDFSALNALNCTGAVSIGSFQAFNVMASNVKLQIRAAKGRLDVVPHSASLYGGSVAGSLSLDANGNVLVAKENLSGININPLLKDAIGQDLIEGNGSAVLDITARGDTVSAMKRTLSGTASFALGDGAIKGINLAKSLRDLKARFSGRQDAVQQASLAERTDFSEFNASFRIAGGLAHNENLSVKSPFLRLAGNGDIDIGNGTIDYTAKASVVATAAGQGAKDLDYLKGLTVPVRITGALDKPSYKIEFRNLAAEAIKAKAAEKVQAVQQKAQEQMQDRLKGLLRK